MAAEEPAVVGLWQEVAIGNQSSAVVDIERDSAARELRRLDVR